MSTRLKEIIKLIDELGVARLFAEMDLTEEEIRLLTAIDINKDSLKD